MSHSVVLIPGDFTSPGLVRQLASVLEATGVDFDWREEPERPTVTENTIEAIRSAGTALMGHWRGDRSAGLAPIVELRKALDVYANHRPAHAISGIESRFENIDVIVIRETTEDVYAHLEHESVRGVFESLKVTTEAACERIARHAFEIARKQGRRKVTIVHKANIMKQSDGLFLRTAQRVAQEYPDIEHEDCIVDALCMKLALHPEWFDVLLCGNLFGDIVGDLVSGLVGGRPNTPSVNVGPGIALFTTGHGDPKDATDGTPTSLLFAGVLMLRHLGEHDAANRLMSASATALANSVIPQSCGGTATASEFFEAVRAAL